MKATAANYPELFSRIKKKIDREITKYKIVISSKRFKTNVGRAIANIRKIWIPVIFDIESAYVVFHEISHVKRKHDDNINKRAYVQELEADKDALRELRKLGIEKNFKKDFIKIKKRAVDYCMLNIKTELDKEGLKADEINVGALRFCKLPIKSEQLIKRKSKKPRKRKSKK